MEDRTAAYWQHRCEMLERERAEVDHKLVQVQRMSDLHLETIRQEKKKYLDLRMKIEEAYDILSKLMES